MRRHPADDLREYSAISGSELVIGAAAAAPRRRTIASRLSGLWRGTVGIVTTFALFLPAVISTQILSSRFGGLLVVVLVVAFWVFVSLIHELGHAFAAWLVGWDVHVISVARQSYLPARRRFGNVHLRSNERLGGYVLATPHRLGDWSSWRRVLFLLGGVLANLVCAGFFLIAVPLFASPHSVGAVLCGGFGVVSLFVAVLNLLPVYRDGGSPSDGAQLLDIALGRNMSNFQVAGARIFGLTIDRVPARCWPQSLIAAIEGAVDHPERFEILTGYYLAVGDTAKALAVLRRIEPNSAMAHGYRSIHAFLVALVERDAGAARAILTEEGQHDYSYWRARFVILAVEGKQDEARAAVLEARKAAQQSRLASPDADDEALMAAIENGGELPTSFGDAA